MIRPTVATVGKSLLRSDAGASNKPDRREDRQSQVRQPIGQHPRLGVGLIEEDEITQPAQTEPDVPRGVGLEVGQVLA